MKQKWLTIVCFVACAGLMVLAVKLDGMFLLLSFAMIDVCALPLFVRFDDSELILFLYARYNNQEHRLRARLF